MMTMIICERRVLLGEQHDAYRQIHAYCDIDRTNETVFTQSTPHTYCATLVSNS
jgi:hypothetical protein